MSKQTKGRKKLKGPRTRDQILETAALCIAEFGIERTTSRLIARRAQVSNGLISHYCPKMDDLLLEVLRYIVRNVRSETRAIGELEPNLFIQQIKRNFESFHERPHYYQCILLSYYYCTIRKEFLDLHNEINRGTFAFWRECLHKDLSKRNIQVPEVALNAVVRSVMHETQGALLDYFVDPPGDRQSHINACVAAAEKKVTTLIEEN